MSGEGQKLKSAVIGTGKISEEHLKFLGNSPLTELCAVVDLSPSMAGYSARRFGAKASFTNYFDMLAKVQPNVVHILTPPHTHEKLVSDCLSSGAHVICEKPVALSQPELLRLWQLAEERQRVLIEDHNYRYNRGVQAIENLVNTGQLGEVRDVEVRMNRWVRKEPGRYMDRALPHPSHKLPCGALHEFVTHLCYLALRFMPAVECVKAAWRKHGDDELFKWDDLDALVIGGKAHARIRFASDTGPECFTVKVAGTLGSAETDLFNPYLRIIKPRKGGKQLSPLANSAINGASLTFSSIRNFKDKIFQRSAYEGMHELLKRTYEAIVHGTALPVAFTDMDATARLIDQLLHEANQI